MSLITLDFETYYDDKVSLKRMTTLEYINHPEFKIHMLGIKEDDKPCEIIKPEHIKEALTHYFHPGNKNTMLCQNTAFDGLIIQKFYGLLANFYEDTQLMFTGLAPYMSANLDTIAKSLFPNDETKRKGDELASSKGVRDLTPTLFKSVGGYCGNDCDITYDSRQAMINYFPRDEMEIINETLRMWIEPCFRLDSTRVERHMANIARHKQELLQRANDEFGIAKTVLSSNKQFAEWLENRGITVPTKLNDKGKETYAFAKDDLEFIALRKEKPELSSVWDARIEVKSTIEESRAKRLLQAAKLDDGAIRVPLKYYGAHTGRYSGKEKINLQNLTRGSELRRSLVAPEGQFIYVSDLSQIEARMNAWLSGEEELLQDFRDGVDIYSKFAAEHIYHRQIDRKRVEKDADGNDFYPDFLEGFVGKTSILGLGYQMSGDKFRITLEKGSMGPPVFLTEAEAKAIVYNGYRKAYRNIVRNWSIAERHIRGMTQKDYCEQWGPMTVMYQRILLPNGMFLNYPNLTCDEDHNGTLSFSYWNGKFMTNIYGGKLVENVVQALSRIVVMYQMLKIKASFGDILRYALQVHDELIFTGPQERAENIMADIIKLMSIPPEWCADLPTAAEGGYAVDYSK